VTIVWCLVDTDNTSVDYLCSHPYRGNSRWVAYALCYSLLLLFRVDTLKNWML
jgi:hypothetical protein